MSEIAVDFDDEKEQGSDLRVFAKAPIKIDSSELCKEDVTKGQQAKGG